MTTRTPKPLRYRQIHLDFHTSEHIPAVGAAFDAEDFVQTLKRANVDSVTLFAKCHHGWSYYPTKVGHPHPNLVRPDLLGDIMRACAAADIETPVYITVQWDERTAREHQEWRAVSATNQYHHADPADPSALKQLSPAWHTLCLNHAELRSRILEQAREVAANYNPPGLFFDIILTPDCVCNACIARMLAAGLDPEKAEDRLRNDEAVNEQFRRETSAALFAEFPDMRVFYNCGHIHKQGRQRFATYTHLELESLPTGGWGYDHFPSSARYAAYLGFDFLGQTGKFHTSWGEFGGFKQPDALDFECAQMAALGAKCLVGDQLHPSGAINHDTYKSIAPAYARLKNLEPYLKGARQVSEVGILSAEYFHPAGARNNGADDGAAQMLQELKRPFDVIDAEAQFDRYPLLLLPDTIPVEGSLADKLRAYVAGGGKLLLSGNSGMDADAANFTLDVGLAIADSSIAFNPSYLAVPANALDSRIPLSLFVMYGEARNVRSIGAEVLGSIHAPYFNRSWRAFSSHQHTPDNPDTPALGVGVAISGAIGYIAYPICSMYRAMGQPLYKYVVGGLLSRLLPEARIVSSLPSSARAVLTHQPDQNRYVAHLLYGAPQVRGKDVPAGDGTTRVMEMIEDVPALGAIDLSLKLDRRPNRVTDALTGEELAFAFDGDRVKLTLTGLHIHRALALAY